MAFNDVITRTMAAPLIPEEVFPEILAGVAEQSAAMKMARRLPNMTRAQERVMVSTALATAYFPGGDSGLSQTTTLEWKNRYVDAAEVTALISIPKAVIADANYDIWANCKPEITRAIGKAIDQALFYGTNIPSSWSINLGEIATPRAGLVARCTAASHTVSLAGYTDLYEVLLGETPAGTDGVCMLLEADGYVATGYVGHTSMRGKLRNCRDANGQPIFKSGPSLGTAFATGELDGSQILYPLNGSMVAGTSLLIAGQWDQLVYSVREDLSFELSTQAVLTDAAGNVTVNLFQQRAVALMATIRIGFALPNPVNAMNETELTRCPFSVLTA